MTRAEWDALTAREKDAVVAEKVMGRHPVSRNWKTEMEYHGFCYPFFTTSWDAMREVVEKMIAFVDDVVPFTFDLVHDLDEWWAIFHRHDGSGAHGDGRAPTAPEAVYIAALTALGHMEPS